MPTFHLLDGPLAGSTTDGSGPPDGYVVVAPKDLAHPGPLAARWITEDERARYLRLGAALVDSLTAQGLPTEAYSQYLNSYRSMSTPEPGFGYFNHLDNFEQTGHL